MNVAITDCPPEERAALHVFDEALVRAAAGADATLTLRDTHGREHRVDAAAWCRPERPGDDGLLGRCDGATLDVGCGPGRLTGALLGLGRPALGIDVSATAVRLARARGALALRRDVFAAVPGQGRWEHLLLADGNLGIGGDPAALLRRCRDLLAPDGRLHAEVEPPGAGSWSGPATLHDGTAGSGAPLRWAQVAADDLAPLARAAGLLIRTSWTEAGRWFATLAPA
ncbi:methyltransferase type 12 [Paractinoplanes deccanensis]|uniref:Methyltransferase type 12 n=1 Tax=Paractinoplanes deccanensis TaxID=113561 RepID=A0ABQ3XWU9_9ACTN|nr:class I SAM-dependent methyltransferase [Actinoplanes deccanensis]GID72220.1 methyltransferase type 12 [Actinoplanes deccanensis]